MECPYCKKEMEKGNIYSGDFIRWWPEGADRFMTVPEEEGAVRLHTGGIMSSAKAESWYCAECRMVITPVPEIEDPLAKVRQKWDAFTDRIGQESEKRQAERAEQQHQKKKDQQRKKDPWEV